MTVAVLLDLVRREELAPVVEGERAGVLALVDGVRARARGDADRARGDAQRVVTVDVPLARLRVARHALEDDGRDRAVLVRDGLGRRHVLDEIDSLFERLRDLFVVQPVGGRVDEALAVDDRDAAPLAHERHEVRRFARARGALALRPNRAPVRDETLRAPRALPRRSASRPPPRRTPRQTLRTCAESSRPERGSRRTTPSPYLSPSSRRR